MTVGGGIVWAVRNGACLVQNTIRIMRNVGHLWMRNLQRK
ncbi:hypothetical protein EVA_13551 [gut metagenome]|uniref:Uncharacterized protein n=1 Tax=gut metagenome TaxID=749906 RepID=J9G993_9ZZZZ